MDHCRPHFWHRHFRRTRMETMVPFLRWSAVHELGEAGIRSDFECLWLPLDVYCGSALGGPWRVSAGMVRLASRNARVALDAAHRLWYRRRNRGSLSLRPLSAIRPSALFVD